MSELKPCPFCNGVVTLAKGGTSKEHYWYYISHHGKGDNCTVFMESGLCSIDFPTSSEEEKIKLITAWNRRVKE